MTLLAIWLLTVAGADLMRWDPSADRRPWRAVAAGTATLAVTSALVGLSPEGLVAALAGGLVLMTIWVVASDRAFSGRGDERLALLALFAPVPAALATSGLVGRPDGALGWWFDRVDLPALADAAPDRLLLGAAVGAFLLNTANLVVRLVLDLAGTLPTTQQSSLHGGRMLGPLERTFLFGLALAGELTAASVVIAAKGLLRYPEISQEISRRAGRKAPGADSVAEYFLIGTLTSWLLALGFLPLLSR